MQMLESRRDEIIALRRHFHENPELSFHEEETARYIADFYRGKDVDVQTNVGGNGIIVTIKGGALGKRSHSGLISMLFLFRRKRDFPSLPKCQA